MGLVSLKLGDPILVPFKLCEFLMDQPSRNV